MDEVVYPNDLHIRTNHLDTKVSRWVRFDCIANESHWSKSSCSSRTPLMADEFVNMISQQEFYFESSNFQDNFNMALPPTALHMGHIGQHLHTHQGHNYCQMSPLTPWVNRDFKLINQTCGITVTSPQMVLYMGHIDQHIHAHEGHNQC